VNSNVCQSVALCSAAIQKIFRFYNMKVKERIKLSLCQAPPHEGVKLSSKYSRSQYLMEMGGNDYDNVTPHIHKGVQLSGIRKCPTV
jgi:hypothetical protein